MVTFRNRVEKNNENSLGFDRWPGLPDHLGYIFDLDDGVWLDNTQEILLQQRIIECS